MSWEIDNPSLEVVTLASQQVQAQYTTWVILSAVGLIKFAQLEQLTSYLMQYLYRPLFCRVSCPAEAAGIPVPSTKRGEPPFSMDANLLHISYEGNALEDPWVEPDESMFTRSVSPENVSNKPGQCTLLMACSACQNSTPTQCHATF